MLVVMAARMRKQIYRGSEDEARAIFARATEVHVATTGERGDPILRTVNAVLTEGGSAIAFHGAPAGEKMEGIGRKAVVSASETVAAIPSWFVDPERACPATTYYLSAQAHGVLEAVDAPEEKAAVLSALMAKYQPEGGHRPIRASDPLYRKAISGLLVARVRIEHLACKTKLGQNRTPAERVRILEGLWARGRPEDVRAIATIVARFPELPRPSFLRVPDGTNVRLSCTASGDDLEAAAALLEGAYWLGGFTRERIRTSLERSTALVCAHDDDGALVGFARAVSDGRTAWIYDVIVAERARDAMVGTVMMKLLLDHPALRGVRHVRLGTRDAMAFYRRFGFRDATEAPRFPWPTTEMIRTTG